MRYSNAGEIILITIVWAAILLVAKSALDKPAAQQVQASFSKPQIAMVLQQVGCSEQYKEIVQKLKTLPWLGETRVERGEPAAREIGTSPEATPAPHTMVRPEQPLEPCAVRLVTDVKRVEEVDFTQLLNTLRDVGTVPTVLDFGGLPHFALQAQMADMSCAPCVQAAVDALKPFPVSAAYYYTTTKNPIEVSKGLTFQWVDTKQVDRSQNTITVSVQPQHTARVSELIRAFERIGLLPTSVSVVVHKA